LRYLPIILLALAVALGLMAWAIWFISDAHGHGLASADRRAIIVLTVASATALVSAVALFVRRGL
jgi:hypothetical protein